MGKEVVHVYRYIGVLQLYSCTGVVQCYSGTCIVHFCRCIEIVQKYTVYRSSTGVQE
jgi:hypothetical protein